MEIRFEKAKLDDAEAILDVQIRAFHDDSRLYPEIPLGGPPNYDSLEVMQADIQKELFHVIYAGDKLIGGIVVFDYGEGHIHLDRIFIDPEYHNQGFGTKAMHFYEESYPAKKYSLHTPLYAIRNQHFYEKFGYKKIKEEIYDIVLIYYEKELSPINSQNDSA